MITALQMVVMFCRLLCSTIHIYLSWTELNQRHTKIMLWFFLCFLCLFKNEDWRSELCAALQKYLRSQSKEFTLFTSLKRHFILAVSHSATHLCSLKCNLVVCLKNVYLINVDIINQRKFLSRIDILWFFHPFICFLLASYSLIIHICHLFLFIVSVGAGDCSSGHQEIFRNTLWAGHQSITGLTFIPNNDR